MVSFKVLIVDDDYINRKLLVSILKKELYKIEAIESIDGEDALKKLRKHPDIQLILLDIEMPNVNGLEFLERYHQDIRLKRVRTIAISSNDLHKKRAIEAGSHAFLVKPITEEKLMEAILG
ncbi:MAG TPA: response regulator [Campylobacterales bacterium]|nr:response regulator [Campylobacterales bacterium]